MPENFEGPVEIPVEENIPNLFDLEEDDEEDEDEDKENLAGKFSSLYLNQCTQSNVGLLSELCGVLWSCVPLWDYAKIAVRGHSQDYLS